MDASIQLLLDDAVRAGYSVGVSATKAHIGRKNHPGVVIWLDDIVGVEDDKPVEYWTVIEGVTAIRKYLGL